MSKLVAVHPFYTDLILPQVYREYASLTATMQVDPKGFPARLKSDIRRIVETGVGRSGAASMFVQALSGSQFWNLRGRRLWLTLPDRALVPEILIEINAFAMMVPGTIDDPGTDQKYYYGGIHLYLTADIGSKAGKEYQIVLKKRKALYDKLAEVGRQFKIIDFESIKRAGDRLLGTEPFTVNMVR